MSISYREDLDEVIRQSCDTERCVHCDDDTLFLHCGRDNGRLDVAYSASGGTLSITCTKCQALVLTVAVASRSQDQ